MNEFDFWVNFLANLFTIAASGLAIWLFIVNRKQLATAVNVLVNYSFRQSLTDLTYKIDRLNDYKMHDSDGKDEVLNWLHEIEGQIRGNPVLQKLLPEQLTKIASFIRKPDLLTEPRKRSLVSELREAVRGIDLANYQQNIK